MQLQWFMMIYMLKYRPFDSDAIHELKWLKHDTVRGKGDYLICESVRVHSI